MEKCTFPFVFTALFEIGEHGCVKGEAEPPKLLEV